MAEKVFKTIGMKLPFHCDEFSALQHFVIYASESNTQK